jgi:dihydrofolate reductase
MMMSLDGFIAGPNDEMDWLPPFNDDALWKDIHKQMWNNLRSVDTLLLGRATYQIWERYWPAAAANPASTKNDLEFSRYADETQKVVFSRTLENVGWKNTRLVKENIAEVILKLKEQPGKNLSLAGGGGIAQTFMRLGLIDDYQLLIHPVILGRGKPLFKGLEDRIRLKLVGAETLRPEVVALHYKPL